MSETQKFETWAVVEVLGHQTYAGYVTEQVIAGQAFVRVDVPAVPEDRHGGAVEAYTKYLGPGSIYAVTPVSEEYARQAARSLRKVPVSIYMPRLYADPEPTPALGAGYEEDVFADE